MWRQYRPLENPRPFLACGSYVSLPHVCGFLERKNKGKTGAERYTLQWHSGFPPTGGTEDIILCHPGHDLFLQPVPTI